jgi:uncharacterized protein (DUF58 family)
MNLSVSRSELAAWLRRAAAFLRSPLGILLCAAFSATLLGLFVHAQAFLVLGGLIAVLALGIGWPALALAGCSGQFAFERTRSIEGEPTDFRLALRNVLPWTAWGLRLRLAGDAELPLPPLGGRRSCDLSLAFTPPRRGLYPAAPPLLATDAPFGLWTATRRIQNAKPLLVWPHRFPVGPLPEGTPGRAGEGLALRDVSGSCGEMIGTRPYRAGDPVRRIHWPQTARHATLIVREHQTTAGADVQVLLDLDPAIHSPDSAEWAIRVAASFAVGWSAAGAHITLLTGGQAVAAGTGTPATRTRRLLDTLALVQPGPDSHLDYLLALPEARRFRRGLRLIVTTGLRPCPTPDSIPGILTLAAVLDPGGFHIPGTPQTSHPAWLTIASPADIPRCLLGTAREVRHAG